MGARLEYLQIPIVFGLGSALVTMVGTNAGAGQKKRAERIAWAGAGLAAAITGSIGLAAALYPAAWMGLFSRDPAVLAVGATYLRIVGPAYGFFGLGLALYFASQGAGRLMWPLAAGFVRLMVAAAAARSPSTGSGPGCPASSRRWRWRWSPSAARWPRPCGERARDARRVTATDLYIPHTRA